MQNEVAQGFRLSPQQKHLWKLRQASGGPYSSALALLVEGDVNEAALRQALRTVVERNEILRTTFEPVQGMSTAVQVIRPDAAVVFEEWGPGDGALPTESEQLMWKALEGEGAAPDAEVRVSLFRESSTRVLVSMALSAMKADEQGLRNLVEELASCYGAAVSGEQLDEVQLQYADLAEWQNELLVSEDTRAGRGLLEAAGRERRLRAEAAVRGGGRGRRV